jgi:hypothetical protein
MNCGIGGDDLGGVARGVDGGRGGGRSKSRCAYFEVTFGLMVSSGGDKLNGKKFSKVLNKVTLYRKYTRALTFEKLC